MSIISIVITVTAVMLFWGVAWRLAVLIAGLGVAVMGYGYATHHPVVWFILLAIEGFLIFTPEDKLREWFGTK